MSSSSRVPPLLQPYVRLPREESLLLLTSTLGASANWLLVRFLCDALSNSTQDGGADEGRNVVLVSWMRDYDFWRQEARKGAGLDLERLKREKRFAFVDGLSGLALGDVQAQQPQALSRPEPPQTALNQSTQRPGHAVPARGPPGRIVPVRGPPPPTAHPARPAPSSTAPSPQSPSLQTPAPSTTTGHLTLTSPDLAHLKSTLTTATTSLTSTPPRATLLILDTPDLPLAITSTPPSALTSLVLQLHDLPTVSHILTHLHADTPLLSASTPPQPLEVAQYNFLTKMAHMSSRILGTRVLDTGVARDVSGVVRVTEQRSVWGDMGLGFEDDDEERRGEEKRGKEFLYRVKGDGSVKVFERGAGGEG